MNIFYQDLFTVTGEGMEVQFTIEDLYQAFKARLTEELMVDGGTNSVLRHSGSLTDIPIRAEISGDSG